MDAGLIGGVAGALIGVAGGIVGTWAGIHNTRGPRERAFMVRASLWCWLLGVLFLAGLLLLPKPWGVLMWVPYAVVLPLGIRYANRRQADLRAEDARAG